MITRLLELTRWAGIAAFATLTFLGLENASFAQQPAKLEPVMVSTSIETLDGLVTGFGAKEGIFRKHGIELSFVRGANGPANIAAVVGGSAELTHMSTSLYFPAIEKGQPFKIIAGNYDIDYTLIGQKKLPWPNLSKGYPEAIKDLKGRRVGVAGRGGATELYVRKMVKDAGLDPDKDVTIIAVGTGFGAAGAFINDQVDALAAIPPSGALIGADNYVQLVDIGTTHSKVYAPGYMFTVFASNEDFVAKRPQVAQNFCRAVRETVAFVTNPANRDKMVAYVATSMNLKPEQAAQVWDGYKGNFNATLTRQRWDEMKKFSTFVPDWEKTVYQPCAQIASGA